MAVLGVALMATGAYAQQPAVAPAPAVPLTPAAVPAGAMPAMPVMPVMPVVPSVETTLPDVTVPSVAAPLPVGAVPVAAPAAAATEAAAAPEPELPTIEEEPAGEAVAAATAPDPTPQEDPEGADYSYGTANYSLLYTRNQISKMKSVLNIFESRRKRGDTAIKVVEKLELPDEEAPMLVPEPALYPVFTLKSIVFRNNRDWTVWIGNLRITPKQNDQEVRVIAVGPNIGQFIWKPAYGGAMHQRAAMKGFAKTDNVAHKLTKPNTAAYDDQTDQVSFTLRQNQTFAPAYMATFEGKVAPIQLPKMEIDDSIAEDEEQPQSPSADTSAANPTNLDALLKAQQQAPGSFTRNPPPVNAR